MTTSTNPHPVDPTGPLPVGSIPDADLDRLIAATIPATEVVAVSPDTENPTTWRDLADQLTDDQVAERKGIIILSN